jgi:creatinine amidohydrolase/Fe(II)-dependent formamide hydrolase-like protein
MKQSTVFLAEMTNPEVERFLKEHDTVIVPVGSTEQHGPAGPLATGKRFPADHLSERALRQHLRDCLHLRHRRRRLSVCLDSPGKGP